MLTLNNPGNRGRNLKTVGALYIIPPGNFQGWITPTIENITRSLEIGDKLYDGNVLWGEIVKINRVTIVVRKYNRRSSESLNSTIKLNSILRFQYGEGMGIVKKDNRSFAFDGFLVGY